MTAKLRRFVLVLSLAIASTVAAQQPAKAPVKPLKPHAEYQMRHLDSVTLVCQGNDTWVIAAGWVKGIKDKEVRCWQLGKQQPVIIPGAGRGRYYSKLFPSATPGEVICGTWSYFLLQPGIDPQRIGQDKEVTEGLMRDLDFWDVKTQTRKKQVRLVGGYLYDISRDAKYAAVLSAYGDNPDPLKPAPKTEAFDMTSVTIYEIATGKTVLILKGHKGMVRLAKMSPDGDTIVTTDRYENDERESLVCRRINIWSLKRQKKTAEFSPELTDLESLVFAPDGKTFFTRTMWGIIRRWDVATHKVVREYAAGNFAFSPDGKTLALSNVPNGREFLDPINKKGPNTAIMKLFDLASGKERASWLAVHEGVKHLCFSPDGKFLLSADSQNNIKVWKLP